MEKKLIILLFLMTGCRNSRAYACSRYSNDDSITINLNAINDTILAIHVREAYKLPHTLLYDKQRKSFLDSQLDDSYHYLFPDEDCSLQMTLEDLKTRRYICE